MHLLSEAAAPCTSTWIGTQIPMPVSCWMRSLDAHRLLNEIVWTYHGPSPIGSAFNRKHDTILAYAKGASIPSMRTRCASPTIRPPIQTFKSSPKAGFGKVPDLERGKVPEDWWYFPVVARLAQGADRLSNPEAGVAAGTHHSGILESGRTGGRFLLRIAERRPSVAARLGRRFIACDSSFRAIHTTRTEASVRAAPEPFSLERDRHRLRRPGIGSDGRAIRTCIPARSRLEAGAPD